MEKNSLSTNLRLLTKVSTGVSVSPAPAGRPAAHSGCTRGEPPSWGRPQRGGHPPAGDLSLPPAVMIEDQQRLLKGLHKGHKVFFLLIGELEFKDQVKKLNRIL